MPTPTLSVLMAVYRPHPLHFPEAVASVLAQSFTDFEFVIVEDPGTAGVSPWVLNTTHGQTPAVPNQVSGQSAAELLKLFNDPRIRLIANAERTGLLAQRNCTLAEAKADWVALIDADDAMEPGRLAKQWDYLQSHTDTDVLGSQLAIINSEGRGIGTRKYPQTHEEIVRSFRRFNAIAQPSVMARKTAMVGAGGYTFEFPVEDYDLWSRMAHAGAKFANHPEFLTRYRLGGSSKSEKLRKTLRLTREVKRKYWRSTMNAGDRLRYWGEAGLLGLPVGFVEWLFRRMTYGNQQ